LAAPTVLGVLDTYGIELIQPMREGRRPQQMGRTGLSTHRWIGGGQWWRRLHQGGVIVAWAWATAHVADHTLQWVVRPGADRMMVLRATAGHAAEGDPTNLTLCQRGEWEDRIRVETGWSLLPFVGHVKQGLPRVWEDGQARLAFPMAACHVLVQWQGFSPNASGCVPLSVAELSL
jgi:hypothetical protein